jgi:DNA-binding MarR family transcriptional regulator
VSASVRKLAELDRVIHEPGRLMIVSILFLRKEADFLYLVRETGLTKGNLSSHLARLEEAGYLEIEKSNAGKVPLTVLRLTAEGRSSFRSYQAAMKKALS